MAKHRGVSKWYLESYVKSFQFVHNHRHYGVNGRFLAALAAILDQYRGGRPDPGLSTTDNTHPVLIRMFLKRFIFH